MRIIGLTGPSGAGKSTLCEKFCELGIPCINTDEIYHEMTSHPSPCLTELANQFGSEIITAEGTLDRPTLARLVFAGDNKEENLKALNAITHKYVWEQTNKLLTEYIKNDKKAAVIDAPALFSSRVFVGACDTIISVLCDKETRLERIIARDGISRENALHRLNSQPDDSFFIENSDYYVMNSGTREETVSQLLSILHQEGLVK